MGLIRLLLALAVVRGHASRIVGLDLIGGQRAVELFYIISGFYMALILNGRYASKPRSVFYSNRALRIFPVYLATLLLMFALGVANLVLTGSSSILAPYYTSAGVVSTGLLVAFALANVTIIGQAAMLFVSLGPGGQVWFDPGATPGLQPAADYLLLPQAWTLDVELMFYAVAPFLVRRKAAVIVLVAAASVALRLWFYSRGYDRDPWTYRFFPFELALFMVGALCYRVYERLERIAIPAWCAAAAWVVVLFVILSFNLVVTAASEWVLFVVFVVALPLVFRLTRTWRLDAAIGELSYPVYLTHVIVIGAVRRFTPAPWLGDVTAVGSIALSIALIKLVADPVEAYRARRIAAAPAVAITLPAAPA